METATYENVQEIAQIEAEALRCRTRSERFGDWIATKAGRMWFIVLHAFWFTTWMIINTGKKGFDPYPFSLLTMIVSLESIFLSLFILNSQSRSSRQADRRSHLDLQINLLSEHENTKMLQMLQAICTHHGISVEGESEIAALAARTRPQDVLQELEAAIPSADRVEGAPTLPKTERTENHE